MQPFVNPNYFNQYQMIPNYTQQYPMQPMNQQMLSGSINGRVVDNLSEITANDVPMDNTTSVFPKRDMSEIYCKRWNNNGTISTVVYKPEIVADKVIESNITEANKIDDIISRLERIEKNLKPDPKKKVVIDNE